MKTIEEALTRATQKKLELQTWIQHSLLFVTQRKVRLCEDIVKLCQKHLFLEFYGKKHIIVGEIEEYLGYKMRVSRDLVNDSNYYQRKMATEIEDGHDLIAIIDRENESMK